MFEAKRPKLEILGGALADAIIDEGFDVLARTGVLVENEDALEVLGGAGARVDRTSRRAFPDRAFVERCLRSAPGEVRLHDRAGGREFRVGGDEVHFDPGSAAVSILDPATGAERKPFTGDLLRFYDLVETLEHVHFQSTGLVSADVPHPAADAYRLYLGLRRSVKPFVTGTFRVEGFAPMREMLAAVRGGAEALAARPLAIFDACPSPPLKWSRLTAQSLVDAARAGIPSELISMGMTGATSPVTLAGTLVQHVAENLAGVCIVQAARPGAPVIFGGSPSAFDLRKGTTPMGAIETMMIDAAYAQIGKRLGLPTHAYMALSDAKVIDTQAGLETGLGAVLAALAGINVVSGPGMLDFESCQSLEKLVIDDEICAMIYRLLDGVAGREDILGADTLAQAGPDRPFLALPHTRKWYRAEHIFPRLADRDTYEAWAAQGRKPMARRAAEDVERRLAGHVVPALDEALDRELRRIMESYAKAGGVECLPAQ